MPRQEVAIPFVKARVAVVVDFENHPAIEAIAAWGSDPKRKIEEACFADYRDKVASVGPKRSRKSAERRRYGSRDFALIPSPGGDCRGVSSSPAQNSTVDLPAPAVCFS
jgi:hypothetical protein